MNGLLLPYELQAIEDNPERALLVVINHGPDDLEHPTVSAMSSLIWTGTPHRFVVAQVERDWSVWMRCRFGYQLAEGVTLQATDTAGITYRVLRALLIPLTVAST